MPTYRDFRPDRRFRQMLALSPDCTQLAYADDADGQFNLKVQGLSSGHVRQLTSFTASQLSS